MNKFKYIIGFLGVILAAVWLGIFSINPTPEKLTIIACDVGQGDAFLIIYKEVEVLVDGGPSNSVVNCLDNHMPFWDRSLEMVILTHPDRDHYFGLIEVSQRFEIKDFVLPAGSKDDANYKKLLESLESKKVPTSRLVAGDNVNIGDLYFDILWPGEDLSFTSNELSQVFVLRFGKFKMAFTGDIEPPATESLVETNSIYPVNILKVPHHGSKNGLTKEMLDRFDPVEAVISSGLKNQWGHPNSEIIQMLEESNTKIYRTDQMGEIKIETDGDSYQVIP